MITHWNKLLEEMVGWREGGLWMWLGHDHGGAGLVAGLNDPEGLLQP